MNVLSRASLPLPPRPLWLFPVDVDMLHCCSGCCHCCSCGWQVQIQSRIKRTNKGCTRNEHLVTRKYCYLSRLEGGGGGAAAEASRTQLSECRNGIHDICFKHSPEHIRVARAVSLYAYCAPDPTRTEGQAPYITRRTKNFGQGVLGVILCSSWRSGRSACHDAVVWLHMNPGASTSSRHRKRKAYAAIDGEWYAHARSSALGERSRY